MLGLGQQAARGLLVQPDGGSGLTGLADRVAALGGQLTVTSPPGCGTIIQAELPCG
jgi:signal transduction histidine kinase